jgi:hypothetical protein
LIRNGKERMTLGEAYYYMKADGCNDEKFEKIKQFFIEGAKSGDFWQENRGIFHKKELTPETLSGFWVPFEKEFPMVSKYLTSIGLFGKDFNNALAGYLDFGNPEEVEENIYLSKDGELRYSAFVWHFADWNPLMKFLKTEFGLVNARYVSDEYLDPYDAL